MWKVHPITIAITMMDVDDEWLATYSNSTIYADLRPTLGP